MYCVFDMFDIGLNIYIYIYNIVGHGRLVWDPTIIVVFDYNVIDITLK